MTKLRSVRGVKVAALVLAVLGTMFSTFAAEAPAGDQEELKFNLPEQVFSSTPLNYPGPNLEPPIYKRPPFLAPKGTTNLAKGKPVTASGETTMGKLEQITDGEKKPTDGYVVELKPGKQWVQIDLGQKSEIFAVLLWHFFADDRVYFDIVVQVSDDPEFTKDTATLYNNDIDNTLGLGKGTDKEFIDSYMGRLMDAKGVKGRYVRFYSKGNTTDNANHYIEVEVYGKPAA